jgi:dimethylhistidine N-methyltransferase
VRRTSDLAIDNRFAQDVHAGLRAPQKMLPPQYFYDAVGSALFEAITFLPEYGLTRAEERLLQSHSGELAESIAPVTAVLELGSGSGRKTQRILTALLKLQKEVSYFAIDVSASSLSVCCEHLNNVPGVRARGVQASYLEGLARIRQQIRPQGRVVVLFLGSTIGNFSDGEMLWFLKRLRSDLRPGDAFLLGADLVKPADRLIHAYDDPGGITSAFNLNLLARINRELNANFNLRKFRHEARWISEKSRIEMHLISLERQSVIVEGANCEVSFEPGESIWTESSRKFTTVELARAATQCGFSTSRQWVDNEWPFAEILWIAQ